MSATRRVKGTVRQLGIEGGVWALVTDEGETIELIDAPDGLRQNGKRAEVELEREGAEVTIGMTGDAGRVRSHRLI